MSVLAPSFGLACKYVRYPEEALHKVTSAAQSSKSVQSSDGRVGESQPSGESSLSTRDGPTACAVLRGGEG